MRHLACPARYFSYCHLHKKWGVGIDAPLDLVALARMDGQLVVEHVSSYLPAVAVPACDWRASGIDGKTGQS